MEDTADTKKAPGKMRMVLALILAIAGAGAGFYAVQAGFLDGVAGLAPSGAAHTESDAGAMPAKPAEATDVAFVEIDPLLISLGGAGRARHLRFRAQLEVVPDSQREVNKLMPRIVDVLNGYLRALDIADLENPSALHRLRAQMLRRVQIVTGRDAVRDLLIMEFVLN